jgi:hypothetical protein
MLSVGRWRVHAERDVVWEHRKGNPVLVDDSTLIATHFSDFLFGEFDFLSGRPRRLFLLTDRDWRSNAPTAAGGVNPGIMDARVDTEGRLWLLVRVGDPNWEEVVERRRPGLGRGMPPQIGDKNGYWDSVVEVIDLNSRRVLARERYPQFFVQFLESGELVGFRITEDTQAVVEVFDVQLRGESCLSIRSEGSCSTKWLLAVSNG